jgi:hypothetical protein
MDQHMREYSGRLLPKFQEGKVALIRPADSAAIRRQSHMEDPLLVPQKLSNLLAARPSPQCQLILAIAQARKDFLVVWVP